MRSLFYYHTQDTDLTPGDGTSWLHQDCLVHDGQCQYFQARMGYDVTPKNQTVS